MNDYQLAYGFLNGKTTPDIADLLYKEDYFLTHYTEEEITCTLTEYIIDYLPEPMTFSEIYFYEFDHDHSATNIKWRQNRERYTEQFRRTIMTLLGYQTEVYIDSSSYTDLESPHILKINNTLEDIHVLDEVLLGSLHEFYSSLILLPKQETFLFCGACHLNVHTNNQAFLHLLERIVTANGLYLRKKASDE